ncbi:hypothetical protein TYRP_018106 [Tyrophagus putrescentiae]|nr:hypothetical protein TYRP_018106 [Tyrophagus putrescentiae]
MRKSSRNGKTKFNSSVKIDSGKPGEKTVCTCRDGSKEVDGHCEVRHRCNISHFNRDYLQADCPHASQNCTEYRCFCRAGYTQVEDGCLPEEIEVLDPVALVGLFLLVLVFGTLLLAFFYYLFLKLLWKIKSRYCRVEERFV